MAPRERPCIHEQAGRLSPAACSECSLYGEAPKATEDKSARSAGSRRAVGMRPTGLPCAQATLPFGYVLANISNERV